MAAVPVFSHRMTEASRRVGSVGRDDMSAIHGLCEIRDVGGGVPARLPRRFTRRIRADGEQSLRSRLSAVKGPGALGIEGHRTPQRIHCSGSSSKRQEQNSRNHGAGRETGGSLDFASRRPPTYE